MNRHLPLALVLVALTGSAQGQSVTPMRGLLHSFADSFAVRIAVGNPYAQPQVFSVRAYDDKFYPIDVVLPNSEVMLPAGASRSVLVIVPFNGQQQRRVRICAEGIFGGPNTSKLRTQVCGKFQAKHLGQ